METLACMDILPSTGAWLSIPTLKMATDKVVYAPPPISFGSRSAVCAPTLFSFPSPAVTDIPPIPTASRTPSVNIEIIPPPIFVPRTAKRPRSRQITLQGIREVVKVEEEEEARNPIQRDISSAVPRQFTASATTQDPSLASAATNFLVDELMSAEAAAANKTLPYATAPETREGSQTEECYIDASLVKGRKHKHKHKHSHSHKHKHKHSHKHHRPIEQKDDELPAVKREKIDTTASAFTSTPMPPSSPGRTRKIIKFKIKFLGKNLNPQKIEENNGTQSETTEMAKVPFHFDLNELPPPDDH